MLKFLTAFKKKKVWVPSAIVLVIILFIAFSGGGGGTQTTVAVERGTVVSEVSLTGKVTPAQSVDLAFEKSGRLQTIHVSVGQKVQDGQTLVELDNADMRAQVAQAQAQYDSQVARLQEAKRGSTPEELAIAQTTVANAYQGAYDAIYDAYGKSNDAVRIQTAALFDGDEGILPKLSYSTYSTQAKERAEEYRRQAGLRLDDWYKLLQEINSQNTASIETMLGGTQTDIKYFLQLFEYLDETLNGADDYVSQSTIVTYKGYVSAGRTQLNTALSNIGAKEQAIAAAKRNLELEQSGSTAETIAYQEAQVANALAQVQYAQSQLSKAIIRAPFAGTITRIPFNKGDIVQPQEIAVSLIGTGAYQIETNVTESDIAKIELGDTAQVTLDAYTDDVIFEAEVIQIDLSETIVDGVPTYKTTLQLTQEDSRIISGMTADIDIVSERKEGVIYIPTRNIRTDGSKKFVQKATDEKGTQFEEVEIKTGLRGSDGRTEIISGLDIGDRIATE